MAKLKPIAALATAPVISALHVIRASGAGVFEIVAKMAQQVDQLPPHGFGLLALCDDHGSLIDHVIALKYAAPRSYTGEDVIELICHGSPLISQRILEMLYRYGCVPAEPGEFTRRAMMNGKLDLLQAEAVNDLIHAESSLQHQGALNAVNGLATKVIGELRELVLQPLLQIEVDIDYPEYEASEQKLPEELARSLKKALSAIEQYLVHSKLIRPLAEGIKVAIVGPPNAGKSSLLNALARSQKALVSAVAGTTRDVIEVPVELDGIRYTFADTAGIRKAQGTIERLGVSRARSFAKSADLIINLWDASRRGGKPLRLDEDLNIKAVGRKVIAVANKVDMCKEKPPGIAISAKNNKIAPLLAAISATTRTLTISEDVTWLNVRQHGLLQQAGTEIKSAITAIAHGEPLDLVGEYLRGAVTAIDSIVSGSDNPGIADAVFARFCVGK